MRLLFCLFAEDIGLLPRKLFSVLVERTRNNPANFTARFGELLKAMAVGGAFGVEDIAYFNGDLFTNAEVLGLSSRDLEILSQISALDWSSIEPAIFGTLFERSLDPDKRAQLGAHYTSRNDIVLIVEPVLMAPLRQRWTEVKAKAQDLLETKANGKSNAKRLQASLRELLLTFVDELSHVRVLDPACGSGNFLYVALKLLLDLWKEVSVYAATHGLSGLLPYQVRPSQLYGIEKNIYAQELASVVVWIGYIQWLHDNGFGTPLPPILERLDNIRHMDAILVSEREPEWPEADYIIGNPPFLGGKRLRSELGDEYVDNLFKIYKGRVPHEADLVTYWFEKARAYVEQKTVKRVGLLATQGIRGGVNRKVLERIKQTGDIFWAQSDRNWILNGAAVHVSMVGFDNGSQSIRELNNSAVDAIHANLTSSTDLSKASRLTENIGISFMGDTKGGKFDLPPDTAELMLVAPANPNGRPNSDVVVPWINGSDINGRPRGYYIVDFGTDTTLQNASFYEMPFKYVTQQVREKRSLNNRELYRTRWWIHAEPRPEMRKSLVSLERYIATTRHSKHRLFAWKTKGVLPDSALIVFARSDDYFFGILHSRAHELWSRAQGTQVREVESGFRYTPNSTFETFPFPWAPGTEPTEDVRVMAIAAAAKELAMRRDAWLNVSGATPEELKLRTLTALYNEYPQWLKNIHLSLDVAVCAAYGWSGDIGDNEILERLLTLNQSRAAQPSFLA